MKWHTVNLPDYFTHLLKINLTDHNRTYRVVNELIGREESFGQLIYHSFGNRQVDQLLQSLGWFGFRERLAALFLTRISRGEFDQEVERNYVDDLVSFEECFKGSFASGYSRAFLLGMYLKIAFGDQVLKNLMKEIPPFLEFSKSKVIKIDWVIIMLFHFSNYLGESALRSILEDGIEFEDIFNFLKKEQKEEMLSNMLAYGNSIDEPQMFINDTV